MNKSSNISKKVMIKYLVYLLFVSLLVFLDQLSKYISIKNLKNNKPYEIISGIIELRYLENDGMAWGILGGKIQLFAIFTIVLIIAVILFMIRIDLKLNEATNPHTLIFLQAIFVLLIAGAIGNLIDRIKLNYVVDFIYFKVINFPIFNIADCYVVISTLLLFLMILFFVNEKDWELLLSKKRGKR